VSGTPASDETLRTSSAQTNAAPRTRSLAWGAVLLAALLIVIFIGWYISRRLRAEECFTLPVREFAISEKWVLAVDLSPDGRFALSGGETGTLHLWDVGSGKEVGRLIGHTAEVRAVAFSPDGKRALSGGFDGTARLWDVEAGRELRQFTAGATRVYSVAFSPDGKTALTGHKDGAIRLWNLESGIKLKGFPGHPDRVGSVTFSPDGRGLLSGCYFGTVRLGEIDSGEGTILGLHPHYVGSAVYTPDGRYALSGGGDNVVRIWLVETGKEVGRLTAPPGGVNAVAVSPDGRRVLAAGFDEEEGRHRISMRLWELETGRLIRKYIFPLPKGERQSGVLGVAFSRDGRFILSGGGWGRDHGSNYSHLHQGTLRLWRVPDEIGFWILGTEEIEQREVETPEEK